ncbi:glycerophosphodiester phosphodiesterase [Arthrobacter oryzae]|uniref:glycerophosphodiester phosphodiesterase n=1 Tax=Arthrobacter oryzae TaxID=409290 RepID=UPI00278000D4|nr:glycerophosphodiester phosphodiesterase [Arthrobacter oryzae]MDQ0078521.1 glycerophosphoryl diester phosphodiesterase [Arthrobacter oryzae]
MTNSFFIAHRGSGDNWPEHTAYSYGQAVSVGAKAIEVSLSSTSDGVLVCHHLTNTQKLTGQNWNIADRPYSDIAGLRNDARQWLGPASPRDPIPKVKDVLDAHASKEVIFIEDKQGTNTNALLDLLDSYPDSTEHFVWKQSGAAKLPGAVRERGYTSWGYFTDSSDRQFERFADTFDLLGIYHDATDDEIRRLVSFGKPVICWEVHTRWMRQRLEHLGVRGMMCSNLLYVTSETPKSTKDSFASGLRAPGDLPWIHTWESQPVLQPESASIRFEGDGRRSYVMGSMCPITSGNYTLTYELRWPTNTGAAPELDAGIAFGQADDRAFRPWTPNEIGGYYLALKPSGKLELFRQEPKIQDALSISSVATEPPVPGEWMRFRIDVAPAAIRFARLDGREIATVADDTAYRGAYFSLFKSHPGGTPVEFRAVEVTSSAATPAPSAGAEGTTKPITPPDAEQAPAAQVSAGA